MLAHVPVVSQHTHRHMGGYFGQLPQDVIKSPAIDRITTFIWEYQYSLETDYSSNIASPTLLTNDGTQFSKILVLSCFYDW